MSGGNPKLSNLSNLHLPGTLVSASETTLALYVNLLPIDGTVVVIDRNKEELSEGS